MIRRAKMKAKRGDAVKIDYRALEATAIEDATRIAPPPMYDPAEAGLAVALASYAVCSVFALVLRLPVGDFHVQRAMSIAAMMAGGITFYVLWRQKRHHKEAFGARYEELLREASGK